MRDSSCGSSLYSVQHSSPGLGHCPEKPVVKEGQSHSEQWQDGTGAQPGLWEIRTFLQLHLLPGLLTRVKSITIKTQRYLSQGDLDGEGDMPSRATSTPQYLRYQ